MGTSEAEAKHPWLRAALEPADAYGLATYRALLGTLMVLSTLRFCAYGWIDELYVAPAYHFTYPGLDWIAPWPGVGTYVHFALMGAFALALAVGLWTRLAAFLFCLAFSYVELIDKATYLNHYYLVSLMALLLTFVPSGAVGSLDGWWRRRRGRPTPTVRRYHYWLLRSQIAIVYLCAGLAKLNADWLLHAEPLSTWLGARADVPLVGGVLAAPLTAHVMSVSGAAFDCSVPFLLSWRRTRGPAFAAALAFHVFVWLLFPIGVFSWVMIASTTLFFDPGWPRRWLARASRRSRRGRTLAHAPPLAPVAITPRAPRAVGPLLAVAYLTLQALLPARFLLYPGQVNWHGQGFRFAWRVMLIETTGQVSFEVRADDRRFSVYPRQELTPLQYRMMSTQPDMIRQFARRVRTRFEARGYDDVRVFADTWASLNGRPGQRLIDPDVDLGRVDESWAPAPWIVPLSTATPHAHLALDGRSVE